MFSLEMDFFFSLKLEERKLSVIKCHLRGPPLGKKAQNIGDAKLRVRPISPFQNRLFVIHILEM